MSEYDDHALLKLGVAVVEQAMFDYRQFSKTNQHKPEHAGGKVTYMEAKDARAFFFTGNRLDRIIAVYGLNLDADAARNALLRQTPRDGHRERNRVGSK